METFTHTEPEIQQNTPERVSNVAAFYGRVRQQPVGTCRYEVVVGESARRILAELNATILAIRNDLKRHSVTEPVFSNGVWSVEVTVADDPVRAGSDFRRRHR